MDDFEIYLRAHTYELKLFRPLEKFIARIKWLPAQKGLDMLKESMLRLREQEDAALEDMRQLERKVRQRFDQSIMRKTEDLIV